MDNIQHVNQNPEELSYRPQIFATSYFNASPSYFKINALILDKDFFKQLIDKSLNMIACYDNVNNDLFKYLELTPHLIDKYTTVVNNVPNFHKSFDDKINRNENLILYFNIQCDAIDFLIKDRIEIVAELVIYYDARVTDLTEFLTELSKYSIIDDREKIDNNSYIALVTKTSSGSLTTQDFAIKNPKMNLPLSYGAEFKEIDKKIFKTITNSDKGLWILHGNPGTGKSMYIRNLIKRLNKSLKINDVIYMTSEMIGVLDTPDFIPFIQEYRDSVLIIEDADIALEARKNHGSIVKTILQLTDGILADCLRLKIVATFNCELSSIDEALLRKGRLQIRHEFRYLTRDEALLLAADLKIDLKHFDTEEYKTKNQWTLAEIYNIQTDFYWEKKNKKLGFGQ